MISSDKCIQLRTSYIEIGKLVQKYGYGQYNGVLNTLMGQVRCIDSNEDDDEKTRYLIDSYNRLFITRGGLGDFIIYDEELETRKQLNELFNAETKKIWEIMKEYI